MRFKRELAERVGCGVRGTWARELHMDTDQRLIRRFIEQRPPKGHEGKRKHRKRFYGVTVMWVVALSVFASPSLVSAVIAKRR